MTETHFELATRKTIERDIKEAFDAGDMNLTNDKLDIHPYGKPRPEITLEQAMRIGSVVELPEAA